MGDGNPLAENPASDPEDRVLVLRAKSGDRDALEELVAQASPQFIAELGDDGVVRLRWARRPGWGGLPG